MTSPQIQTDIMQYFNAANDYIDNLPPDTTYGEGPFREARILIDGQVAGAAYPYATFFTGAFSPPAWRFATSPR